MAALVLSAALTTDYWALQQIINQLEPNSMIFSCGYQ
jgi:hypothetical protein